jgi:hypothetical protein
VHGNGRVPGQRRPTFDVAGFVRAREHRDIAYQLSCYASGAEIRVVDPDSPPDAPRTIRGDRGIRMWLDRSDPRGVEVTHLVDGGDRVAITERWKQPDGTAVVATSTVELQAGLIASQHTVLAWAREPLDPLDGWTRLSKDLWSRAD